VGFYIWDCFGDGAFAGTHEGCRFFCYQNEHNGGPKAILLFVLGDSDYAVRRYRGPGFIEVKENGLFTLAIVVRQSVHMAWH
jgi:hypothetical protein